MKKSSNEDDLAKGSGNLAEFKEKLELNEEAKTKKIYLC
jgi:hypothetical protein